MTNSKAPPCRREDDTAQLAEVHGRHRSAVHTADGADAGQPGPHGAEIRILHGFAIRHSSAAWFIISGKHRRALAGLTG
ncbi:MAG: hypothetical protein WA709_09940 [Stellaceae bacterium]